MVSTPQQAPHLNLPNRSETESTQLQSQSRFNGTTPNNLDNPQVEEFPPLSSASQATRKLQVGRDTTEVLKPYSQEDELYELLPK